MQTSFIKFATFDRADALVVARFWAAVLGGQLDEESTSDKAFVEAPGWGGPGLWFNRVPEPKTAKNRLVVMEDPEGNELCVEEGPGDAA